MKNWIKAFLLIASPLLALDLRCADWEFGAGALYWRPCSPSFEFAEYRKTNTYTYQKQRDKLDEDDTPIVEDGKVVKENYDIQATSGYTNELFSVDPDYNWGARVWVGYTTEDGCNFGKLDWTWVRISDAREANRNTLRVVGFADTDKAKGWLRHVYNRANLRFGHRFYSGCNVKLFAYAGARFVDIDRREKTTAVDQTLKNSSQYTGGGFELGFLGQYDLGCGFGLVGNLSGLTILGRQKTDVRKWLPDNHREGLKLVDRTQCVAGWDVSVGINYAYECFRFAIVGEIGYEVNYYLDAIAVHPGQFGVSVADTNADNRSRCINQGFGGPYASLMIRF